MSGYQYQQVPQYTHANTQPGTQPGGGASYSYPNTFTGATPGHGHGQTTYGASEGYGHGYGTHHPEHAHHPKHAHHPEQTHHYGPSDRELKEAYKGLRALQKQGLLKPFVPKMAKWKYTHNAPKTSSSSSKPKPKSGSGGSSKPVPKSSYMCSCGRSYGNDNRARAALESHLNKHTSHKRVKAK